MGQMNRYPKTVAALENQLRGEDPEHEWVVQTWRTPRGDVELQIGRDRAIVLIIEMPGWEEELLLEELPTWVDGFAVCTAARALSYVRWYDRMAAGG